MLREIFKKESTKRISITSEKVQKKKCKNLFFPLKDPGHNSSDLVDLTRILFVDAVQRKGSQQCHRLVVKLQAAILEGDVVNNGSNELGRYLKSVFKLSKRLMWKIYPLIGVV